MRIEVLNRNIPGNRVALKRVRDQARRIVSRVAHEITDVTVKVEALAGRSGSESREALVLMQLRGGGQVVVRKRGESVMDLVLDALRQARLAVSRRISRRRRRSPVFAR